MASRQRRSFWYAISAFLLGTFLSACSDNDTAESAYPLPTNKPGCICGHAPARNAGMLLYESNVLMELDQQKASEFEAFIRTNASLLQADGPTIQCAKRLGNTLISRGLGSYSRVDYDRAYESVLANGGTIEMASDVAGSMQSGALDAVMTGQELLWLAEVIPPAARGDWSKFTSTGTEARNQVRMVAPMVMAMPDMAGMLQQVQPIIDQLGFGPMVADQMVLASCLLAT